MKMLQHSTIVTALAMVLSSSALAGAEWKLVWADEFSSPQINRTNWTYDLGANGWGNQELQCYTDRPANSYITNDAAGNGMLVIEAKPEEFKGAKFTSARLKTQGLQRWTYGKIEARISIPGGKGIWPAFWMLGENMPSAGWPACGEIDILEHVEAYDMRPTSVRSSLHGPVRSAANSIHGDTQVQKLAGNFHTFTAEWESTEVRWYLDGKQYFSAKRGDVAGNWVFDHPFFIIMNVAVGGSWPGAPDATTKFPARMLVDYVRVYQK
jgi:beta-glucanase (GH16 family)